jgi:hypothetical protein
MLNVILLNVINKPFMLSVVTMLNVTYTPFMLSVVIMLNVVMLSVVVVLSFFKYLQHNGITNASPELNPRWVFEC